MTTWLLAGASGFLGTALRVRLATEGDEVLRLVRREPAALGERRWDPAAGELDPSVLDGVDAVVDLAGVNVFTGPWTSGRREAILSSRVQTTSTLARALAARGSDAPVLLQAGGVAWYGGDRTDAPHVEGDPAAPDFLAQVCVRWEEAAQEAVDAGARVVFLRTSPVLDRSGGPFLPMRLAWSLGLGTVLGTGTQRMPLISLADYLGVVRWAAATPHARGAYNLTIPQPCTNAEFTDALARALHRPRLLRAPAAVLRGALGELSGQLLGDMWVLPQRLLDDGYAFEAPDVDATVAAALRGANPASEVSVSTPAVEVRLVRVEDAPALAALLVRNRQALAPWDPVRPDSFFTAEGQRRLVGDALRLHAGGESYPGLVLVDGEPAGRVNLNNVVHGAFRSADLGYWVDAARHGRGVGTAAVAAVLRVAFDSLDLHRVQAGTLVHNHASRRVLAHNGFYEIGLAPRYLNIAGRWQDHVLHQVLADDPRPGSSR